MREQTGMGQRTQRQSTRQPSPGHYAGLHPANQPVQPDDQQNRRTQTPRVEPLYDDWVDPPSRSNTRRYQRGEAIIDVTDHRPQAIPARAHKVRQTEEPQTSVPLLPKRAASRQRKRSWLRSRSPMFYFGASLMFMLIGWMLFTFIWHWIQVTADDWHYGRPRTFQTNADVGHGGVSHFTVENLGGHIYIFEVVLTDPKKYKLYEVTISGGDSDLAPATVSFRDVNHNGLPEMIVTIGGSLTDVFTNSPDGFTTQNPQGG